MNYRALFIDMDDTLLDSQGRVSPANLQAIQHLNAMGVEVIFCSGRPSESLMATAQTVFPNKNPLWIVGFNGSQVLSLPGPTFFQKRSLDAPICRAVLAEARRRNLLLQAYHEGQVWAEHSSARFEAYTKKVALPGRIIPDLDAIIAKGTPKLLVNAPHEVLLDFQASLAASAAVPAQVMVFSKPEFLEFVPSGSSKGTALEALCSHLGIATEAVIAAGDSQNDIEMLELAGMSVAPSNARAEAKAAAKVVLQRSNEESIVPEIIERFFAALGWSNAGK